MTPPLKKRSYESDDSLSSEDEIQEVLPNPDHWSFFLFMSAPNDGPLKLNPFVIAKDIEGLAGYVKEIKKLRSGSLLIEYMARRLVGSLCEDSDKSVFLIKCNYCKKPGHKERQCYKKKRDLGSSNIHGIFTQNITREDADIDIQYFAHRKMTRLLITIINVSRRRQGEITLNLSVNRGEDSEDLTMNALNTTDRSNRRGYLARTKVPEVDGSQTTGVFQVWTHVPEVMILKPDVANMSSVFITAVSTDQGDALLAYDSAVEMSSDSLLNTHVEAWRKVWEEGSLEVNGNPDVARTLNAGLYYILSSIPLSHDPLNPFMGLSPGGLSRGGVAFPNKTSPYNDYLGHVFWDMDTWILPPVMSLHPHLAALLIGSRTRVLPSVRQHANKTGYQGARFPWEQAQTDTSLASGEEVCPWNEAAEYQVHVTADVSLALRQYLYATDDVTILADAHGLELAMDVARFWASRVVRSDNGQYEILGVMGPDEYHYNVNNSVFTNYNARLSLELPAYIRDTYNPNLSETEQGEIETFSDIAKNMLIMFDEEKQYHPQFEGFALNESIKQSDVVLLGFPLMMTMPRTVRKNDLIIYENLTDRVGPDTGTWSMHSLTRLELDEEEEAADDFRMMFRNINGPFKIFSEKPASNPQGVRCVNFITAAGGLLQAALFGYAGIRYHDDHLDLRPCLLPNSTDWAVRGLHYKGFTMDIEIFKDTFNLTLVNGKREKEVCLASEDEEGACEILELNKTVTKPQRKFKIYIREPPGKSPGRPAASAWVLRPMLCVSLVLSLVSVFTVLSL
ncbi:protein-glucosylgalactosylhydroxylysine glucosidase-like [Haliotis asinina]|uniref:protein-glucosylgalactosylhydroxylysine glucosidase-like n=1 Tax=Haliotis asinina TaxID=109174 RepID=UPI0035327C5F